MARDFNQNRNANATLKGKNGINSPGIYYALSDGADGYNVVEVSSLPTIELFIGQGTQIHEDITEWTLFNSQETYGGIGANAFGRFPNLETITIWQEPTDNILTIDDNAFASNVELDKIYVHPSLLSVYQTTYSGKSFASYFEAYALVNEYSIPTSFNGEIAPTTLTNSWILKCVANMPLIERNVKTTIIVPSYFTGVDIGAFSGLGSLFSNITELKCNGTKTFNAGFLNGASWCIHLWLDNGSDTFSGDYVTDTTTLPSNFRTLAPYLVFTNYFMSEYSSHYPVIGYNLFASGDTLPLESPTGTYLWFSNINFDTDYNSPTGLENDDSFVDDYEATTSGYYYCYDKTTILVIQGSGTLTAEIVQNAINSLNTPLSWITKLIIDDRYYLGTTTGILDNAINNYIYNVESIRVGTLTGLSSLDLYTGMLSTCNKVQNLICKSIGRNYAIYQSTKTGNLFVKTPGTTQNIDATMSRSSINLYFFSQVNFATPWREFESNTGKLFIASRNSTMSQLYFAFESLYCRADVVTYYQTKNYSNVKIGVLDGSNIYQKMNGFEDISFNFPKLTGIDTEANIQLLTPANDSLYLASDTGNLWQYVSGTWSNLFTGYTATWYSDEDCTITVLPNSITSDMTVYVKLTAI